MVKNVYAVYDKKLEFGATLVLADNDDVMIRDFANVCNQPGSLMFKNPEDFTLNKVGTFDTKNGALEPCAPVGICSASDFVGRGGQNE